ncbi:caspase family protein [Larkinella sp. VNQ87]|uniref:caspase family protein n=1 Tax=Larkinella sp. VNQ87 TaxID=3400921 RepID=UPI003C02E0FD
MKWFLLSAWILTAITNARAQQTYAVVLGVADYVGTQNDLHYADADARLITQFLRSPRGGRVPASHIVTLTNNEVTRVNVLRAFRVFELARPGDRIIFYFSGHGLDGKFFTYNGQELLHQELKNAFRRSAAKTKIVWADACYSGSMRRKTKVRLVSNPTYRQLNDPSLNIIVMASSRSSQSSAEYSSLRQGAFTFYMVKGAEGAADKDRNGVVTIGEHFRYVYQSVRSVSHNTQIPIIYGKFADSLPVTVL